jgi:hypothetical protein
MQMEEDNLVEKPPMQNKSVAQNFYNRDIVLEWLLKTPG